MSFFTEADLLERGWIRDVDGIWRRPGSEIRQHQHSVACTAESCGENAVFFCPGDRCLRAARKGETRSCTGHRVPTRDALVAHSLRRSGITQPAPRGTPLDDDAATTTTNTWSSERDEVSRATKQPELIGQKEREHGDR